MPQPISKIVPDPETFITGNPLADKPDMAQLVCRIFAVWAQIEQQLNLLFYVVLGTEAAPAIAIFAQLRTQALQSVALEAAAKAALSLDDFEIFKAAITVSDGVQTARNHLAHWTWGGCRERPDLLVLFDPQMLTQRDISVQHSLHTTTDLSSLDLENHLRLYFFEDERSLAYSKGDLERSLRDLSEAHEILTYLRLYLRPRLLEWGARIAPELAVAPELLRPTLLEKLNGLRLFREALARIRASRKNTPPPPHGPSPQAADE